MNLRAPRRLTLLALLAPAIAVVPLAAPASAVRPDDAASPHRPYAIGNQWSYRGAGSKIPDGVYAQAEVTTNATFGITTDGQVVSAVDGGGYDHLVAPTFDRPIVDLGANAFFGVALDDQGRLHSWGSDSYIPAADRDETYRDVAAGGVRNALGVTTDGEVRVWGDGASVFSFDASVAIATVDVHDSVAVALTEDGHVLSSGEPLEGTEWESSPFPADHADDTFVAIDAGTDMAIALTTDGEVVTWGFHRARQNQVPTFASRVVAVSAGRDEYGVVLADGTIKLWGDGEGKALYGPPDVPAVDLDLERSRAVALYAALAPVTDPAITGAATYGSTLAVEPGTWNLEPEDVTYEWFADEYWAGFGPSYTPTLDDVAEGRRIRVVATAYRADRVAGTASSAPTAPVAPATFTIAPAVTVSGTARVGQVLTATATTDPVAGAPSYQWLRGSTPIAGAAAPTYTPTAADLGQRLAVRVTSATAGYEAASATSAATAAVQLGAASLKVSTPKKAKAGSKATITITGLAAGERFTVTVAGKRAGGKASRKGVGTVRVPVSGKPGSRRVTVVGSLPDRTGVATLRVVKR